MAKQLIPILDTAPGKELIPAIRNFDVEALKDFYHKRVEFFRHPMVTQRMITYDIFYDLLIHLETEHCKLFLPVAIELAMTEHYRYLHCAMAFISNLEDGFFAMEDKEPIREAFKKLFLRVKFCASYFDYQDYWESLIFNFFEPEERRNLRISDRSWKEEIPVLLPPVDDLGENSCPEECKAIEDHLEVMEKVDSLDRNKMTLKYFTSVSYKGNSLWIYTLEDHQKYKLWNYCVYAATNPQGVHRGYHLIWDELSTLTVKDVLGYYIYFEEGDTQR